MTIAPWCLSENRRLSRRSRIETRFSDRLLVPVKKASFSKSVSGYFTTVSPADQEQSSATDKPWERRHPACPVEQNISPTGIYNFLDNKRMRRKEKMAVRPEKLNNSDACMSLLSDMIIINL